MAILKYMLHLTGVQHLNLHKDAKPLDVQEQNNVLCLWADTPGRVISAETTAEWTIYMVGTGHDAPPAPAEYLRTIQTPDANGGILVIHVYVEKPRANEG